MAYAQAIVSKLTNYIKQHNIQNLWYFFKAVAFTRSNIDWHWQEVQIQNNQALKELRNNFLKTMVELDVPKLFWLNELHCSGVMYNACLSRSGNSNSI